jgi:putative transposase
MTAPNQVWTTDFKGQFRTRDGVYSYPLTMVDHFSRCVRCCQRSPAVKAQGVHGELRRLFRTHGLPDAIRSDDGAPERIHRVLKAKVTKPAPANAKLQQRVFNTFVQTDNECDPTGRSMTRRPPHAGAPPRDRCQRASPHQPIRALSKSDA